MGVLRRGPETVAFYPSIESDDGYGDTTRLPGDVAVVVAGLYVLPIAAGEDASSGQSAPRRWRVVGRIPHIEHLDAFAEAEWAPADGTAPARRFDIVGQPIRRRLPRALAHTSIQLAER